LFKKTCNSYIVGINDIEVDTLEDAILQTEKVEEVDDRIEILTL
jgi:hypothetical protein